MKRLLILCVFALAAPSTFAGTATFGLIPHYGKCGSCSACPGPWNAFSPRACCAVENANGCTLVPAGYFGVPYLAGGFPVGYGPGHRCGLLGCGFFGHPGLHTYGWHGVAAYPCGAVAAWHGLPGMGGCADPFSGCGMLYKPTLKDHLHAFLNPRTSAPPKHLWDYFGGKMGGSFLGDGFTFGYFNSHEPVIGGCVGCDAPVEVSLAAPAIAPTPSGLPTAPASLPAPVPPQTMQPVSHQVPMNSFYYYPMPMNTYGYGFGYYPLYGYNYGVPMGW
ncbi:MAG: hypothetical protein SNJ75_02335 [Gemmataceae bacterium]